MSVRRPSPAMLVAVTALVVSLGGNSYAAVKLAKNSVTSKAIKDGQVQRADLARNAVGSPQVADGSLLAADFKAGQLPAGPQGLKGDKGDKGDPGHMKLTVNSAYHPGGGAHADVRWRKSTSGEQ